jgi:acyl-CoA thioester hydrolase
MIDTDFANCLTAEATLRVPFFDLDPAGVAWHGRYFQYFELARCALFERFDYSYDAMEESGYLWPVADTAVRYLRPLTLDQAIRVIACLREWELRLVVDYRIENAEGVLCTRARTVQVPVDANTYELTLGSPQVLIDNVVRCLEAAGLSAE